MTQFALTRPLIPTLTGSQDPAATPLANLLHYHPGIVWQSTNLTSAYIQADLGSSKEFDRVALLYSNLTSAATWQIRADDSAANLTTAPAYDSGTVTAWASPSAEGSDYPHALLQIAAAETLRYVRIDLTDAANPDSLFRAGRLYIGKSWSPELNPSYGMERGMRDGTIWHETDGGSLVKTSTKPRRAVGAFTLSWLSEAEREATLHEIERDYGSENDVLLELPGETATYLNNRLVYAKLDINRHPTIEGYDTYQARLSFEALA